MCPQDLQQYIAESESESDEEAKEQAEERRKQVQDKYRELLDSIRSELPEELQGDDEDEEEEDDDAAEEDEEGAEEEEEFMGDLEEDEAGDEEEEAEEEGEEEEDEEEEEEEGDGLEALQGLPEDGAEIKASFYAQPEPSKVIRQLEKSKMAKTQTLWEKREQEKKDARRAFKKEKKARLKEEALKFEEVPWPVLCRPPSARAPVRLQPDARAPRQTCRKWSVMTSVGAVHDITGGSH